MRILKLAYIECSFARRRHRFHGIEMIGKTIAIFIFLHLIGFLSLSLGRTAIARDGSDNPNGKPNSGILRTIDEADLKLHAEKLKAKLKERDFTVLVEKPFVVIGDEPEAVVKQRTQDTVKW